MRSDFRTDRSEAKTAISAGRSSVTDSARRRHATFLATTAMAAAIAFAGGQASAQGLTWDTDSGGGTINGGDGVWLDGSGENNWSDGGGPRVAWTDGEDATFSVADPTSNTVTVDSTNSDGGDIIVDNITFDVSGYTLEPGQSGDTLSMTGIITPHITVTNSGHLATINADIDANQLILEGAGNLTLGGAVEATVVSVQTTGTVTLESGGSITDTGTGDVVSVQTGAFTANAGSDITGNVTVADLTTVTLNGAIVGDVTNDDTDGNGLRMSGTAAAGEGVTGNVINNGLLDITGDLSISGDLEQNSTSTLVVDHDTSVGTLTITSGDVEVNGGDLAVSGVTELNSASTLTVEAGDTFSTDSISDETPTANTNAGTITVVNGQVQVNNLLNNSGTVNLEGVSGATLAANGGTDGGELAAFDGSLSNSPAGTVALSGDAEITGSYTHIGAATLTLNNNTLYAETASVLGTLTISGTGAALVTTRNDSNNPNSLTVSAGGVLTVQSGNSIATNDGAVLVGTTGTLNIETGGSADSDVTVAADATGFDLDGSVSGTVTNELATAGVTLAGSIGGDLINNGALEMDGALAVTGDVDSGGTFNITDTLTIGDGTGSGNMGTFDGIVLTGGLATITTSTTDSTGTIVLNGTVDASSGTSISINTNTVIFGENYAAIGTVNISASDGVGYTGNQTVTLSDITNNTTADGQATVTITDADADAFDLNATNGGTLDFDAGTTTTGDINVTDGGTLDAGGNTVTAANINLDGGTVNVTGTGEVTAGTVLTVNGGTDVDVAADTVLSGSTVNFQGGGVVNLTGTGRIEATGTATLNIDTTVNVNGTTLADVGGGDVIVDSAAAGQGIVNFNGAGGGIESTVADGDIIVSESGQINVANAGYSIDSFETFQNTADGLVDIDAAITITAGNGAGAATAFDNTGTGRIDSGAAGVVFDINNDGDFSNSATGTNTQTGLSAGLIVSSGDLTINAEGAINNTGTIEVASGATLNLNADDDGDNAMVDPTLGSVAAADEVVNFQGGTVTVADGGTIVVGTDEDGLFVTGGTLNVAGTATDAITGDTFLLGGTTNVTTDTTFGGDLTSGGGTLDLSNGGAGGGDLTVTGDYTFNAGSVDFGEPGTENTLSVQGIGGATVNADLTVDDGELEVTAGAVTVSNGATLTVAANGVLDAATQDVVVDAGSTIDNSGDTDTITLTVNGDGIGGAADGTFNNLSGADFDATGDVGNSGTITNQGTATFSAVNLTDATGVLGNTGTVTNSGTDTGTGMTFSGAADDNGGTIENTSTGLLAIGTTANGNTGTIQNTGTGTGSLTIGGSADNNTGTIENTNTGTLSITGNAASNADTIRNSGAGTGSLTIGGIVDNNTGTIENTNTGSLSITGTAANNFGIIQNTGAGVMSVGAVTNVSDGQLNNTGEGTLTVNGAILNNGLAPISGTPATVTVSNGTLISTSTVTNTSGQVSLSGDGILQATGFTQNAAATADAVTQLDGTSSINLGAGTLANDSGTVNFNGGSVTGNVTNDDQVNVQAGSTGTSDVTGTYTQTAGDTDMQGNFDVDGNVSIASGSITFTSAGSTFSGGTATTDTFTVSGDAAIDFSGATGTIDATGVLTYSSSADLTVTTGSTLEGDTVVLSGTTATVGGMVNEGTIRSTADANPNDIELTTTMTSTGLIDGNFTNSGTLFIEGSGTTGVQGDFTNASATTLTDDLDVTGTFTNATGGSVDFDNGNLTGFTLSAGEVVLDADIMIDGTGSELSSDNNVVIADGVTVDIDDAATLSATNLLDVGDTAAATINSLGGDIQAASTELLGTIYVQDGIGGSSGSASLGALTIEDAASTVTNAGTGTVAIGSVDSDGAGDGINQGTIENLDSGTITVGAAITNTGSLTNGDDGTAGTGDTGNFTVTGGVTNNGGTVTQGGLGTFDAGGTLTNTAGTVDVNAGTLTATTVANAATLTVNGGTLDAATVNNNSGGSLTLDSTAGDGGGFIDGDVVNNGGTATLEGNDIADADGAVAGAQGISGSLTNQAGGTITLSGDLELGGAFTQGNTGGDAGAVTFGAFRLTATSVTIDAPLTVDATGVLESTGAVQVNNGTGTDLTIATGATLLATGQTVTIASGAEVDNAGGITASQIDNGGNFTNTGTVGADEADVATPVTTFNNTGTFDSEAASVLNVTDFNNTGTFNLNGATTMDGNFNNTSGTFDDTAAVALTLNTGNFTNGTAMVLDAGGDITVTAGTFTNSSTLDIGDGSVISTGSGTVNNGTISTTGTTGQITGDLVNDGTIDLDDDGATGTTLTVTGNVTGTGTLAFDADLTGAGSADLLSVGSYNGTLSFAPNLLATGSIVTVNLINGDTSGLTIAGSTVIGIDGSNTYVLQNNGAGGLAIVTDTGSGALAVAGNISLVQSLIGTIVNRPSSPFVSGLAYEDDDNCGTGSWARFTGGSAKGTARTNNGVTNLPSTVEADFYGFTGGVDYGCFDVGDGAIDIAGGMILGYNGGSTTQDVFATNFGTTPPSLGAYQSTTTADFSQTYVGGYVAMAKDAWSADVQLRFENAQFEFNNPSIDLRSAETETQSTTLSGSVSYSYPLSDDLTLVPTAGFGITRSSTDDLVFTDAGGTETGRLSFEDHTTKIGFVGATIAKTTIGEAGDSATNKFITATYYGDFSDDQQATYTSGGATLPVTTESLGDFGELSIGLSYIKILDGQVGKAKQLNASVRADARFSEDVEALSVTAQVRLQF
ncbi:MAG: hypothetical protein JXQ91_06080 [Vannielia sp.]|uniref:hypothetical protein n=1 Tax=Vannielia sp. TaxID=2813045 RepID=UPI003B8E0FB5